MLKVGFWLDWNSQVDEEISLHTQWLHLILDQVIVPVKIDQPTDVARFDGDLLTFDYGGICGGYGENRIVPALLRSVLEWCEENADRLAILWCTFPPDWYLGDFKRHGGVPANLRCAYQVYRHTALEQELKARYF
jgi:hypothetical protein